MPTSDSDFSEALQEALTIAPSNDMVLATLEIRHPLLVNELGNLDSIWLVANDENIVARIEAGAPKRAGEMVLFNRCPFRFQLTPIEAGAIPEVEIVIDNVAPALVEQLDRAVTDTNQIVTAIRLYLLNHLGDGPQMNPVPTFNLANVTADVFAVTAKARTIIDLRGGFPRKLYTGVEFPGLIGL